VARESTDIMETTPLIMEATPLIMEATPLIMETTPLIMEATPPPNKKPHLNMDWFDDVVLVATEGPKFTNAEIVANEVTRYVSEP
jgi:hypothetical protein